MSDTEDKGFKVTDRRSNFEDGDDGEQGNPDAPDEVAGDDAAAADAGEAGPPPGPMQFSTLLVSLGTSALAALGDVPDPVAGQPQKNLPMARQTIDILGILEEKTKGNLTDEEEKLLTNLLYDLRVRYVQAESNAG